MVRHDHDTFAEALAATAPADGTIYVVNHSTQVTDAQVQAMTAACAKQIAQHVAPAHGLTPVPVTYLAKNAPPPPTQARVITVMDALDDPQALGYHDETAGEHIYGVVGTAEAMKQGAQALTGPYSISSILSHEVCEMVVDPYCAGWFDNGHGLLIAYEVGDPVESDAYLLDGVAVSNFVGAEWFNPRAAKTARFDYLGRLTKPFSMTRGGYWVQSKAGKTSQKFGEGMPEWRKAAKRAQFARGQRRITQG